MKRIYPLTLLFLYSLTATLSSCSTVPKVSQAPTKKSTRAPASVKAPTAWGKPISSKAADFLDEIENAKARSY